MPTTTTNITPGQPYTFLFNSYRNATGASCRVRLIRISTQTEYLDDAMTEVNPSDSPGLYKYTWTPTETDYYAVYKYDGGFSTPNTLSVEAVDVGLAPTYKYFLYNAVGRQTSLSPLLRLIDTSTDAIVLSDVAMTETDPTDSPGLYQYQWTAPTTGTWAAYKFTGSFAAPMGMENELVYISSTAPTVDPWDEMTALHTLPGSFGKLSEDTYSLLGLVYNNTLGRWISPVQRI